MIDFVAHLARQMAWSKATFGPGSRTEGVADHIGKELAEVEKSSSHAERAKEWVDVAILGLDGLTREIWANSGYSISADEAAAIAVSAIREKQAKNERREWPDWRNADPNKAIEHNRGIHD